MGTVYIVHLDPPYRRARHYVGHADPGCLQHRLAEHHTCNGPRLLCVQKAAGGTWHLVATFPGTRATERQLKDGQRVPSYCPECTPNPRTEMPAVDPVKAAARNARRAARTEAWKQEQAAARNAAARAAAKADGRTPNLLAVQAGEPPSPAVRGRRAGEQFLAEREGWAADRLQAVFAYITRDLRPPGRRSAAPVEETRAFADHVQGAIADLRDGETAMRARNEAAPGRAADLAGRAGGAAAWLPELATGPDHDVGRSASRAPEAADREWWTGGRDVRLQDRQPAREKRELELEAG